MKLGLHEIISTVWNLAFYDLGIEPSQNVSLLISSVGIKVNFANLDVCHISSIISFTQQFRFICDIEGSSRIFTWFLDFPNGQLVNLTKKWDEKSLIMITTF